MTQRAKDLANLAMRGATEGERDAARRALAKEVDKHTLDESGEIASLQRDIGIIERVNTSLQEDIQQKVREAREMKSQLEESRRVIAEARNELIALVAENDKLKASGFTVRPDNQDPFFRYLAGDEDATRSGLGLLSIRGGSHPQIKIEYGDGQESEWLDVREIRHEQRDPVFKVSAFNNTGFERISRAFNIPMPEPPSIPVKDFGYKLKDVKDHDFEPIDLPWKKPK